jgi:threonine dehydratase
LIGLQDIQQARETISGVVKTTPCMPSRNFSNELRANIWFKYETHQVTGSFKPRGAFNRIRSLTPEEQRKGVIAASAGNHAQGVAFSATQLGIPSTIVMPENTPLIKIDNTERLGGRVVLAGAGFDEAYREAERLAEEEGLVFIPPFEDERIIAGQGTVGLEILEQVPEVEAVILPIGGGGLISGTAVAIKEQKPSVKIYGVQTKAAPSMAESFRAGRMVICPVERSVADGIAVKRPGEITLEHVLSYVDDIETVSEDHIRQAVVNMLEVAKTVTEGSAAAVLAAMQQRRFPFTEGRNVVMVLSGANIDLPLLSRIIDRSLVDSHRLVRFRTHVNDRPGSLAELLGSIARGGGNVVRIQHDRLFKHAGFWEAEVIVALETRNEDHIQELLRALGKAGYEVERLD